ncbi:porin [Azoarcus sp. KH32C]|uniref:porin n=1 Tax=Azoarcus sp. KH32C TaxID=748247 RepID=UPI0002385BE6|nr:porin [Azoarcus sp. KH32C]BAL27353.1 outer membrane protein [Azoarcus sp. KH32C]
MKKTLVCAALGCAAVPAFAQSSNVQIYGIVDAAFVNERNTETGAHGNGIQSGMSRSSRIGFKGTEDLGNGLKATFVLENGVRIDNGNEQHAGKAFGRQAFVALASDSYGTLGLGRQYTPEDGFNSFYDPFDHQFSAQASNVMKALLVRADNSVKYTSPVIAGVQATVIYGFGEQSNEGNNYVGAGLQYNGGPFSIGATATSKRDVTDSFYARKFQLGASYDFNVVKLYALGQVNRDVDDNAASVAPTRGAKSRQWLIGANAPIGKADKVMVSYVRHNDDATDRDAAMWAVGYTHDLSKRTALYAAYARLDNKDNAIFFLGSPQSGAMVPGADRAINLGIRHSF